VSPPRPCARISLAEVIVVIVQNGWSRSGQVMRTQRILGLTSISDGLRLGPLLKPRSSRGWVSGPQQRRAVQGLRVPGILGDLEGTFDARSRT
jgi:hypothetical protein